MQIQIIFYSLFLLFIFAKLKQLSFRGWSLKLNHNPCDEVFSQVRFSHHMGLSLIGSEWSRVGHKANILLCIRVIIIFFPA